MSKFNEEMKKSEEVKETVMVNVRIPIKDYENFKKRCTHNGLKISTVVRGLFEKYAKGKI